MKASFLFAVAAGIVVANGRYVPEARSFTMLNESGHRLEVYWIHPDTRELVLQSNPHVYNGASFTLNSFIGHAFEVRELPNRRTGECGDLESNDKTCRTGFFTVNQNDDQAIYVRRGLKIEHKDNKSLARDSAADLLTSCQTRALDALRSTALTPTAAIEDLVSCVESSVANQLEKSHEEIAFQATIRKGMAGLIENYTCADLELPTSDPLATRTWDRKRDNTKRSVKVFIDRPASKIHLIENFITDTECQAMEEAAVKKLHRATVADGAGGSQYSESRKAMQAGIKVPWDKEADGHPIATVSRKVYDYVNHVLNLNIREEGQEDLMSIQYTGRGANDTQPDRYMPHCDGDCTGHQHKLGNRMATIVMYCTVPTKGGATNFRNSGIHIVPQRGNAVFFSYIDPETRKMDTGFTEHSGCPVIEGEKKIVTQWVRLGVDAENPWNSFNTLGVKHVDADNQ